MQTITVRHNDGTTSEAAITPSVQVAFERHFKTGIAVMADPTTLRMEYMYWLAWYGSTAARKGQPGFDEWLATVAEIESEAEEEADPLDGTPPTGGSLPSPSSPAQA
jgi:hypothetical protein